MPNTKKKTTSSKKKKGGRRIKQQTPQNPLDVDQVLQQADAALEASNVEQAMQLYTYVANVFRNKVETLTNDEEKESNILLLSRVLGKMAETKVSVGDQVGAQQDFLEATNLLSGDGSGNNPVAQAQWKEARASLYLYLGQLSTSTDALEAFKRAVTDLTSCVALMEEAVKSNNGDESLQSALLETRRQLCGAYCSVAELFLTDLCFDENAEQNCETALQAAMQLDDPQSSPDALQAMANLRLSQNRGFEAVTFMMEAYKRVKVGCEAMSDLVGLGTDNDFEEEKEPIAKELKGDALEAANSLPGFEFRCQMAKLLLECSSILEDTSEDAEKRTEQRKYCIESAIQVLGSLMAENDEVIETWFLLGCAFSSMEPKNIEASKHYFETTIEMLDKVKKCLKQEMPTEEIKAEIEDVKQKLKDVKARLESLTSIEDTAMEE